jgi:hypothetical protein
LAPYLRLFARSSSKSWKFQFSEKSIIAEKLHTVTLGMSAFGGTLGHSAMSDLSWQCAAKQTSVERCAWIWIRSTRLNSTSTNQKPPGFAGRFFVSQILIAYSPLPKRRDHHPARRGWVSLVVSDPGCAGAGAGSG